MIDPLNKSMSSRLAIASARKSQAPARTLLMRLGRWQPKCAECTPRVVFGARPLKSY